VRITSHIAVTRHGAVCGVAVSDVECLKGRRAERFQFTVVCLWAYRCTGAILGGLNGRGKEDWGLRAPAKTDRGMCIHWSLMGALNHALRPMHYPSDV
jgi:hypothetical protein